MQQTLSENGFEKFRKKTHKQRFYPHLKGAGRRPIGIEPMLRIHFLQHWFNLPDPAAEEALYDSLVLGDLLHGGEPRVWGDCAYAGQTSYNRLCSLGKGFHASEGPSKPTVDGCTAYLNNKREFCIDHKIFAY